MKREIDEAFRGLRDLAESSYDREYERCFDFPTDCQTERCVREAGERFLNARQEVRRRIGEARDRVKRPWLEEWVCDIIGLIPPSISKPRDRI